jgi:hypothetical protein
MYSFVKNLRSNRGYFNKKVDKSFCNDFIRDTYLTGGVIASLKQNTDKPADEVINDFDIYFKNKTTLIKLVKFYLEKYHRFGRQANEKIDCIKDIGLIYRDIEGNEYSEDQYIADDNQKIFISLSIPDEYKQLQQHHEYRKWLTDKDSLSYITHHSLSIGKFQIILRFVGEPEEVHKYFDFEHAKGVYDLYSGKLHVPQNVELAILKKELIYTGSIYPIKSILRVKKFLQRGYSIKHIYLLKMIFQVYRTNITNPKVLEDQLMGVYGENVSNFFSRLESGTMDSDLFEDLIQSMLEFDNNKTYKVEWKN